MITTINKFKKINENTEWDDNLHGRIHQILENYNEELYYRTDGISPNNFEKITNEIVNLIQPTTNESVRHGAFPYFTINRTTLEISKGIASNDLALDAVYSDNSDKNYGFGLERWSESMRDKAASIALDLINQGKNNEEINNELYDIYGY